MFRAVTFLILALAAGPAISSFPDVKVEKINERIYALLGPSDVPNKANGGYMNNNLAVIGDKGVILVDAGSHKQAAEHILRALRRVTDKPVTHVLITHSHADHHLGLSAFPGAEVIATEFGAREIATKGRGMVNWMKSRSGLKLDGTHPVVPQVTVAAGARKTMEIHGVKLEAISTDTAHTSGDLIVWFPDDKVLASGDILVHGINPNFDDGSLKKWIGVLDVVQKIPYETVLPGHGPLMRRADVIEYTGLITDFYKTVEAVYMSKGAESDVRKKLDLARWQKLGRFEEMMGMNISVVWRQVEEDNF